MQHETKQKAQLERLAFQLDYLGVATPCASHSNHCIGSTDWSAHFDICKASAMIATMSEPPPKTVVVIENLSELATLKPIHSQNHPVFKHDAFAPCYFYAHFARRRTKQAPRSGRCVPRPSPMRNENRDTKRKGRF